MSKFKAGDLALIVGGERHTRNIGKVCELAFPVTPGMVFKNPVNGYRSTVRSEKPGWFVVGDTLIADNGLGYCLIQEKYLIPLRGDFQPEQQKSKEVEA
jgi:hypothetical protein